MVIPREPQEVKKYISRGRRRDYTRAPQITFSYLLGVLHDATERKTTFRIATKSEAYSNFLKTGINNLGFNSWSYKEGKTRNVWIVEFSKSMLQNKVVLSTQDKIDYIRGYFDTEGGVAKNSKVRYYIYFCQKDFNDLNQVKEYLETFEIECGKMHNPSKKVDPNYWRFFIRAKSYEKFAKLIGSFHPEKKNYLRMKI